MQDTEDNVSNRNRVKYLEKENQKSEGITRLNKKMWRPIKEMINYMNVQIPLWYFQNRNEKKPSFV